MKLASAWLGLWFGLWGVGDASAQTSQPSSRPSLSASQAASRASNAGWRTALEAKAPAIQLRGIWGLAAMGPKARSMVAPLLKLLHAKNPGLRIHAALALGKIAPQDARAWAGVQALFVRSIPREKLHLADALVHFGPKAIPALFQLTSDKGFWRVKRKLAKGIVLMGPKAVPALVAGLAPKARTGKTKKGHKKPMTRSLRRGILASEAALDRAAWIAGMLSKLRAKTAVPALCQAIKRGLYRGTVQALGKLGNVHPCVIPSLLWTLRYSDPMRYGANLLAAPHVLFGLGAAAVKPTLDWLRRASKGDRRARFQARRLLHGLTRLGPKAAKLLPSLRKVLTDKAPLLRLAAAMGIGGIGPAAASAVDDLRKVLKDPDPQVRLAAIVALGAIGPKAASAASDVLTTLQENIPRWWEHQVMRALAAMGPAALPLLSKHVQGKDPWLQYIAAGALIGAGPGAFPLLKTLCKHKHPKLRRIALKALGKHGKRAQPLLREMFKDPDPYVRAAAIQALAATKPTDTQILAWIAPTLMDPSPIVTTTTLNILKRLGPKAASATPLLLRSFRKRRIICAYVQQTLSLFGPRVLPALRKALDDPTLKDGHRSCLVWTVKFGSKGILLLPALLRALDSTRHSTRWGAVVSIGTIGPKARSAVPKLLQLLQPKTNTSLQRSILITLRQIRFDSPQVLATLHKAAQHKDTFVSDAAIRALGVFGTKASIPILVNTFKKNNNHLLLSTHNTLAKIGTSTIPALQKAATHPNPQVRRGAIMTLGSFSAQEKGVLHTLLHACNDKQTNIQEEALLALHKVLHTTYKTKP